VQDLSFPTGLDIDQEFEDGGIVLGERPGLGITVDEGVLAPTPVTPGALPPDGPHVRPERAGLRMVAEPDVIDDPVSPEGPEQVR
jgi:hypothetical protein